MYDASTIIGTCINCVAPASLLATFALIVIGAGIAVGVEMKQVQSTKSSAVRSRR